MANLKFSAAASIEAPAGYDISNWDEKANAALVDQKISAIRTALALELGTDDFRITGALPAADPAGRPFVVVSAGTPMLLDMILESDYVEQPLAEPTA